MSAIQGHFFLELEYFAGFGVRSESDWDMYSIPSSLDLLTYPYNGGVVASQKPFWSSPQNYLNYTPNNPKRVPGLEYPSDFRCQVRLITGTPLKHAREGTVNPLFVETAKDASFDLSVSESPKPGLLAVLLPAAGPIGQLLPGQTTYRPETRQNPHVGVFPAKPESPESPASPMSPMSPPKPVHRLEVASIPLLCEPNTGGKAYKRIRIILNLAMPLKTEEGAFEVSVKAREKKRTVFPISKRVLQVTVRFHKLRAFYLVYLFSRKTHQYRLPVFRTLETMLQLLNCKAFEALEPLAEDFEVMMIPNGDRYLVSIQRFESRLTLTQLAHILGLLGYDLLLTRHIEANVMLMFEQISGVNLGTTRWIKLPRKERELMVTEVHKYSKYYYPTITKELLEIIMRRASYARAQQQLKLARMTKREQAALREGTGDLPEGILC